MKKYAIITGTSIDSLSDLINSLADGWEALGGPICTTGMLGDVHFLQAIIRKDKVIKQQDTTLAEVGGGKQRKSLGQIAYESDSNGGQQNWGPWETARPLIKSIHENMAKAVEREVIRRILLSFDSWETE